MKTFKIIFIIAVLLTVSAITTVTAQVTIGADSVPANFSVLELISNNNKGLRLPQLTQQQRDTLDGTQSSTAGISAGMAASRTAFGSHKTGLAMGLQIFNTSTLCVETWNGTVWISACVMCGDAPCIYYPPSVPVSSEGKINTYVNVMYDFQHQTIYSYGFAGTPIGYQWYAKRRGADDTEYQGIPGATAITYTVPADFVKNNQNAFFGDNDAIYNDSIVFICLAKYADGTYQKTAEMDIEFIDASTAGYGEIDGVKYLTLRSRPSDGAGGSFVPLKVALLSLGQSDGNDAGDLGDFYQWGRVADGHERISWSKNDTCLTIITPMGGVSGNTSETIIRPTSVQAIDANGQIYITDSGYGKFIYNGAPNAWRLINQNNLWGRPNTTPTQFLTNRNPDWEIPDNNPCPGVWKVPSLWQFSDLYDNNGTSDPSTSTSQYTGTNNAWVWRAANGTGDNTAGGTVITNTNGEKLFLPALGNRSYTNGTRASMQSGYYWSSTTGGSNSDAYRLYFNSGDGVSIAGSVASKSFGICVRCVAE
jgi:uncharacterized protein (TIGR02145 family)